MNKIILGVFSLFSLIIYTNSMANEIDVFTASRNGDKVAIQNYIRHGGDINKTNAKSYTAFILAAYYGHSPTLDTLLSLGANPCAVDKKGNNAFMGVSFKGHLQVAEWLLKNTNCDVNQQNHAGQTALMTASLFGREHIIKLLLTNGANPNIKDKRGNTSITLAQAQGLSHIVKIIKFSFQ